MKAVPTGSPQSAGPPSPQPCCLGVLAEETAPKGRRQPGFDKPLSPSTGPSRDRPRGHSCQSEAQPSAAARSLHLWPGVLSSQREPGRRLGTAHSPLQALSRHVHFWVLFSRSKKWGDNHARRGMSEPRGLQPRRAGEGAPAAVLSPSLLTHRSEKHFLSSAKASRKSL